MTATLPTQPDTPAIGSADWARPVFERQVVMLARLAEIGLAMAETLGREAAAPPQQPDDAPPAETAAFLAYARVARAVRLTLMLQSKLIADFQAAERSQAQAARFAATNDEFDRDARAERQKARITRIVERIAERQGEGSERLADETAERLDQDDLYGDILARPVSELVDRICRDLGLDPDWPALANEAWAMEERTSAPEASWPGPHPQGFTPETRRQPQPQPSG